MTSALPEVCLSVIVLVKGSLLSLKVDDTGGLLHVLCDTASVRFGGVLASQNGVNVGCHSCIFGLIDVVRPVYSAGYRSEVCAESLG